ncbi:protein CHROMATIN REMODELING 35 [Rutidosis leptorrhynchoides]|uniref:protein CHROMATIN REMODELING 35 n=1 Tax=Rutidosis leptorrhynchoides TaxID=125765 RepID=UPI003A9924D5
MDVKDRKNTQSSSHSTHYETLSGKMMKSEESVSPSPLYASYTLDANKTNNAVDYKDPFALRDFVQGLDAPKYGSVTKDIEDLFLLRKQMLMPVFKKYPSLRPDLMDPFPAKEVSNANPVRDIVMVDNDNSQVTNAPGDIVTIESDDDEPTPARPFQPYRDVVLNKPEGQFSLKQFLEGDYTQGQSSTGKSVGGGKGGGRGRKKGSGKSGIEQAGEGVNEGPTYMNIDSKDEENKNVNGDVEITGKTNKGEYVGVQSDSDMDENDDVNFDGLAAIWNEMNDGLEQSKDTTMDMSLDEHEKEINEECDHSFILRDDIGYVCRVCGVVERSIESIIEFQRPKTSKSTRTYHYEGRSDRYLDGPGADLNGVKLPGNDFIVKDISAHPRHRKQMKPHQLEGFNFLLSNLVTDNPGGCILAHAPGSGKTFMLISFIQSFMAKYPDSRPLVVLPRGILATWKKEFARWQVENIPLLDFYSQKADNRAQQLEVLKQWANERSILFLGYKQFSTIVCDNDRSSVAVSCQEILLKCPSVLILDEGHTPRNKETDIVTSLEKVQTPRKVVLSGTLYQNHVSEVFTILNLVRPKFLRMEDSKTIKRRILSRVPIETRRNLLKKSTDNEFYEVVEQTLLKDEILKTKVMVIEDLREMTSKVLHYYKGDFLDELPGLMDFSVFLNLKPRQKREVREVKKLEKRKFRISSVCSAIYLHPDLKPLAKTMIKDRADINVHAAIDELLEKLDERDGVKVKFYLNLLRLCESNGEKLLVFGNYLLPLKFLLRLTRKVKGWTEGKQMFMITGDHDNDVREIAMDQFNNSPDAKVFFGSIKACGEGISLVGASRIIILDVHLNPSVTRQALGRAFRPGQLRKVYTYRLIAANSPEEEDHTTCFRKESIAKMWFEWNEYCGRHEFEMETIDVKDCGDPFLETSWLNEDITALTKRS